MTSTTVAPIEWKALTADGDPAPQVTIRVPLTTFNGTTTVQVSGWQVAPGLVVCRTAGQDNEPARYDLLHGPSGRILIAALCHQHTDHAVAVCASMGVDWTQPVDVVRADLTGRKVRGVIPGWPDVDCQTCCSLRADLPPGSRPWLEQAERIRALIGAGETPWVRWRGGGRTRWYVQGVGDGVLDVAYADCGRTVLATDVRLGQF